MKKVLLVDVLSLRNKDHARKNIVKMMRKAGRALDEPYRLFDKPDLNKDEVKSLIKDRKGIIIGGADIIHPTEDEGISGRVNSSILKIIEECGKEKIPLLGICYGHQMIVRFAEEKFAKEKIVKLPKYEYGFTKVRLTDIGKQSRIFAGSQEEILVAEYHFLGVNTPKNVEVLAENDVCIQAIRLPNTQIYGVQFHPDFYEDVDGKGTGALEYYYEENYSDLKGKIPKNPVVKPPTGATYAKNNKPLLNFMQMCEELRS